MACRECLCGGMRGKGGSGGRKEGGAAYTKAGAMHTLGRDVGSAYVCGRGGGGADKKGAACSRGDNRAVVACKVEGAAWPQRAACLRQSRRMHVMCAGTTSG